MRMSIAYLAQASTTNPQFTTATERRQKTEKSLEKDAHINRMHSDFVAGNGICTASGWPLPTRKSA